jgi:hypothetical protein
MSLISKGYSGFVRAYLTTYELWQSIELIFGAEIESLIQSLMNGTDRDITLAFYLVEAAKLQEKYPPDLFVTVLAKQKMKRTALGLAIQIAIKHSIFNNSDLDTALLKIIPRGRPNKKGSKVSRYLIKRGIGRYETSQPTLAEVIKNLPQYIEVYKNTLSQSYDGSFEQSLREFEVLDEESLIAFKAIFGDVNPNTFREKVTMSDFWRIVFDYILASKAKIPLEDLIEECARIFFSDYKTICAALRSFHHSGIVEKVESYGYYVSSLTFNSSKLCFLHPSAITKSNEDNAKVLALNTSITFTIVGFNSETRRINISVRDNLNY